MKRKRELRIPVHSADPKVQIRAVVWQLARLHEMCPLCLMRDLMDDLLEDFSKGKIWHGNPDLPPDQQEGEETLQ